MKANKIIYIFLISNLLNISIEQNKIANQKGESDETDDDAAIVQTRYYKDKEGNSIQFTRIQNGKTKNLIGNSDLDVFTPFQIIRIFDSRINNIFEDIIKQSIGIKILLNGMSMNDNYENIFDPFDIDDDEEEDNKKKEKISKVDKENARDKSNKKAMDSNYKNDISDDKNNEKNKKRKFKLNDEGLKSKIKKRGLNKRELIFSRICKYIVYSIILFTMYILLKQFLIV